MNILLVAYTFPPIPYGGTYRSLRLCKELTGLGLNITALTINIYNDIPNDFDLVSKVPEEVEIIRTTIFDPYRKYQIIKNKYIKYSFFRTINKIISFLLRFITIPDHMVFWNLTAIPKALKIIKSKDIDTVIVSSPPNSTLLIGYFLKKVGGVKFVSDLRDPIIGNIAEVELNYSNSIINRIERKIRILFEQMILRNSDVIIANTETHKADLSQKFKDKVTTIRNSFDGEDYTPQLGNKNKKLLIAHFGSVYGLRNSEILFKALKKLEKHILPNQLCIEIRFYGMVNQGLSQDIMRNQVEDYVSLEGLIPHSKAINLMQSADYLLLLKATGPGSEGQIPGKFFEYVGARKPILCIGPIDSEVSRLIQQHNLGKIVEDDVEKMYHILKNTYKKFLDGKTETISDEIAEKFSSKEMAIKFMNIFKRLSSFE